MKTIALLTCLLGVGLAHAEPVPAPAKPAATQQKPAATATAPAAAAPARPAVPATPARPAPAPAAPSTSVPATEAPATPTLTPEQRRQQELLENAERIDKANRELLAKNQELQLQNENLSMQVGVIQRDKSSEGIWKGALAVIAGFLMGWYFSSSSGRRKSNW